MRKDHNAALPMMEAIQTSQQPRPRGDVWHHSRSSTPTALTANSASRLSSTCLTGADPHHQSVAGLAANAVVGPSRASDGRLIEDDTGLGANVRFLRGPMTTLSCAVAARCGSRLRPGTTTVRALHAPGRRDLRQSPGRSGARQADLQQFAPRPDAGAEPGYGTSASFPIIGGRSGGSCAMR